MLLDLSEIFVCPRCRPVQGLVVLVDEIRDRRVVRGHLGCPECEARFPVEGGVLRFDVADRGDGEESPAGGRDVPPGAPADGEGRPPTGDATGADDRAPPALLRGVPPEEAALRLGALLGLPEAGGPFLLGAGLGSVAAALASAAGDEEVLALEAADGEGPARRGPDAPGGDPGPGTAADDGDGEPAGRRVTRVVGVAGADLPVFSGRLGAVAVVGGPAGAVEEAVRAVRAGGRVVVVGPSPAVLGAVDGLAVEVAARDERALVGVRRG